MDCRIFDKGSIVETQRENVKANCEFIKHKICQSSDTLVLIDCFWVDSPAFFCKRKMHSRIDFLA